MAEEPNYDSNYELKHESGKSIDIGDMTFNMTNYHKDVLKMMSMMKCHQMLTDVTLIVGSEKMKAHRVMLAAASPYFKAMFTGGLKECDAREVTIHDVCPATMYLILDFIYTGQIRVTELTVCRLLPAAAMFQVTDVIRACCIFLERQLSPANAIGIANFAEQYSCVELQSKANQYILRNFSQVCEEEEFTQLTPKQLVELIRRDELNVTEEREVYNAVLRWVKTNEEERRPMMHCVLSAVRCQFLTPSFLNDQMKNCEVIKRIPACKEYLAQIFKELTLHKKPNVKERSPGGQRIIYCVGGYLRLSLETVEILCLDDNSWSSCAKLAVPRSGLGAAFVKGLLYAIGGRNTSPGCSYDSDWVDRYDPDEDRWFMVAPMNNRRLGVGVAVVNRLLYAIGGYDGKQRLSTVERYNPDENSWTFVAEMSTPRSGAGVASLKQFIYVVGGYDNCQLKTAERYDTENNTWTPIAPLSVPRSAFSLAAINDKLYAIGGYDGQEFVNVVEVYDPSMDQWTTGMTMSSPRSGLACAVSYQLTNT
nr:kelch-like ECH-associated protein 1 isoform X2 [Halyomorpha halys]